MAKREPLKPAIFRVIREKIGGQTVRVLLEPYTGTQHVQVNDGDEFITGGLAVDPWTEAAK
jgi:hypothetical protein